MSNAWSWADIIEPEDEQSFSIKGVPNLSTCPELNESGQVDKLLPPIDIKCQSMLDADAYDERAAIIQANGVPREWAVGFAVLCTMPKPAAYSQERWEQIVNDGGLFLDQWGKQAVEFGWSALDVFGVHPDAPQYRYECAGLVPLLKGRNVSAITATTAQIDCGNDVRITFYRQVLATGSVALWKMEGSK